MSRRTLLTNACLLTLSKVPQAPGLQQILIEDGRIKAIGTDLGVSADVPRIDAKGGIVMPGMIDTHRHTWQSLLRAQLANGTLYDYMAKVRFGFAPHFTAQDAELGNYVGALDALNSGVTTVVDYSHLISSPDHADALLTGLESAGIRAVFCYGLADVADAGVPLDAARAFTSTWRHQDAERLRTQRLATDQGRIRFGIAGSEFLFAPLHYTATEIALARDLDAHRFSLHVACGPFARGTRYVTRILAKGLADERTLFVHGNVLNRDDLSRMKDLGVNLSVTPESEMQMGMGVPVWPLAREIGVSCGLGADIVSGGSGDLFTQMRLALTAGRLAANERLGQRGIMPETLALTAEDALRAVTIDAARVAGLDDEVGSIEVGKRADLLVLRANSAHLMPIVDPVTTVVMQASTADVDLVMVDGQVVKSGGQLVGVDQAELSAKVDRAAERIVKATSKKSVDAAYTELRKSFPLDAMSAFGAKVAGKALQVPGLDEAMFKVMYPGLKNRVAPGEKRLSHWFLRFAVLFGMAGISVGLYMGMGGSYALLPVHAHLNVLGWVTMSLFGLFYRAWPQAENTLLAKFHFWLFVPSLFVQMVSLAMFYTGDAAMKPVLGAASALVGTGFLCFLIIVWRTVGKVEPVRPT